MAWADQMAHIAKAVQGAFGEPVRAYAGTGEAWVTLPEPLAAGQVVDLGAGSVDYCVLADQDGVLVDAALYTCDLATGVLTMAEPLDLSGYAEPLVARVLAGTDLIGVFDLYAEELERQTRVPGAAQLGIPQQPRPILYLAAADAAPLGDEAEVKVRGIVYRIARRAADDGGLVRLELAPKPADADATQYDRWQ